MIHIKWKSIARAAKYFWKNKIEVNIPPKRPSNFNVSDELYPFTDNWRKEEFTFDSGKNRKNLHEFQAKVSKHSFKNQIKTQSSREQTQSTRENKSAMHISLQSSPFQAQVKSHAKLWLLTPQMELFQCHHLLSNAAPRLRTRRPRESEKALKVYKRRHRITSPCSGKFRAICPTNQSISTKVPVKKGIVEVV